MGFFAMIASLLLGIFFVIIGISRRKQKGWPILWIALGIVCVLIAVACVKYCSQKGFL